MIFEQKIDNICSLVVSALSCETYNEEPALAKTISRVYELRGTVKKLFSKFLSDEFEGTSSIYRRYKKIVMLLLT